MNASSLGIQVYGAQGDPKTPRALVQTSKQAFEAEYIQWRVRLPPGHSSKRL